MPGWLYTLIVGGIVGWLASMVMKSNAQMGILANIVVGIIGSALGFWIAGLIGFAAYGLVAQLAVSVAGAALLIFVLRKLGLLR
jgi:uncharacterized membrane protein YeaQ/YmgE (transglycosylase-associated protein family)